MRTAIGFVLMLTCSVLATAATDEELIQQAKKLNADTRTLEDADAKLKSLAKDKANTAKLVKIAAKMQKDAKGDEKPFRYFSTLVLAKASQVVKDYDSAEIFYKVCTDIAIEDLQSSDHIIRAADGYMDFLLLRKRYDALNDLGDRLMALNGDDTLENFKLLDVFYNLMIVQSRKGDTKGAAAKIDRLIKQYDGNFIFVQMKARLYRDAEKFEEAISTYEKAIEALEENENLKKEAKERQVRITRYIISGIYIEQNKSEEGIKILKELVKADPENATFKNDLGFVMADNDKNLDEAKKLVEDAIALDLKARQKAADEGNLDKEAAKKANPAYIDSLGWVLYKQKKYDEAIKYLLESAGSDDEEGQSLEIWDHVADCYAAMGKKKEALEMYTKALKMEDVSKRDGDRRKKITEKLKKLKAEVAK